MKPKTYSKARRPREEKAAEERADHVAQEVQENLPRAFWRGALPRATAEQIEGIARYFPAWSDARKASYCTRDDDGELSFYSNGDTGATRRHAEGLDEKILSALNEAHGWNPDLARADFGFRKHGTFARRLACEPR